MNDRHTRIRIGVGCLVVLAVLFVGQMLWSYMVYTIPWIFIDVDMLPRAYGYTESEPFPSWKRLYYFAFTSASVLSGLLAVAFGTRLMVHFWNGRFFETKTTNTIRWLGGSLMLVSVLSVAFVSVSPHVMTFGRALGTIPIQLRLNSYDLGYVLCGVLIFIIGWVLGEALRIEQENREFV